MRAGDSVVMVAGAVRVTVRAGRDGRIMLTLAFGDLSRGLGLSARDARSLSRLIADAADAADDVSTSPLTRPQDASTDDA